MTIMMNRVHHQWRKQCSISVATSLIEQLLPLNLVPPPRTVPPWVKFALAPRSSPLFQSLHTRCTLLLSLIYLMDAPVLLIIPRGCTLLLSLKLFIDAQVLLIMLSPGAMHPASGSLTTTTRQYQESLGSKVNSHHGYQRSCVQISGPTWWVNQRASYMYM